MAKSKFKRRVRKLRNLRANGVYEFRIPVVNQAHVDALLKAFRKARYPVDTCSFWTDFKPYDTECNILAYGLCYGGNVGTFTHRGWVTGAPYPCVKL